MLLTISLHYAGLEDQFKMELFPSGKVTVDGFVCVVDVSRSQKRSLEGQMEFINKILLSLIKTKKPIVMAATKMDEGSDAILQVYLGNIVSSSYSIFDLLFICNMNIFVKIL